MTRDKFIREHVRADLEQMAQEALYWNDLPSASFADGVLWQELRDAIVLELFAMDREQVKLEDHAEYIRKNCL